MSIVGPATRLLGLLAMFATVGCGSGSDAPTRPPAAVPPPVVPSEPPVDPSRVPHVTEAPSQPNPGPRRPSRPLLRAPAVATGDPELDLLVSYLKAAYAKEIKDDHRLVIDDMTNLDIDLIHPGDGMEALLKEASDQVPAEMIRDFCEKNRKSRAIWPELTRHLPTVLLSMKDKKTLFSESGDGWKTFYEKYPGSPGIITVSRVGLNRDRTLALLYLGNQRHWLNGEGRLHVLKKEGDVWVEQPVAIGPSWVS